MGSKQVRRTSKNSKRVIHVIHELHSWLKKEQTREARIFLAQR